MLGLGVGVHIGTNKRIASDIEVGDKKFYPSLKAQLKYVLHEIVPPLEAIPHSSKLHGIGGHSYSTQYSNISNLLATSI